MANNNSDFEKHDESYLLDEPDRLFHGSTDKSKLSTPYANEDMLEEWRVELTKLEYEIQTLKSVLNAKNREAGELRKKLGITQITEIKQDIQYGIQTVKDSNAYQKTSSALKNFGSFASQKFGSFRNSNAFKSVEGKVGSAYANVKTRLKPSRSTDGYERELEDRRDSGSYFDDHSELSGDIASDEAATTTTTIATAATTTAATTTAGTNKILNSSSMGLGSGGMA